MDLASLVRGLGRPSELSMTLRLDDGRQLVLSAKVFEDEGSLETLEESGVLKAMNRSGRIRVRIRK